MKFNTDSFSFSFQRSVQNSCTLIQQLIFFFIFYSFAIFICCVHQDIHKSQVFRHTFLSSTFKFFIFQHNIHFYLYITFTLLWLYSTWWSARLSILLSINLEVNLVVSLASDLVIWLGNILSQCHRHSLDNINSLCRNTFLSKLALDS